MKGMWFGCDQPFLWGERCVTSQKTAAEETKRVLVVKSCVELLRSCGINNLVAVPTTLRSD